MQIILDESGDLGWSFDQPFRRGGSSRFLTIAIMFLPSRLRKVPRGIIASMYQKYGWIAEKKAAQASAGQKIEFCQSAVKMIKANPSIKVDIITVKKENVAAHIRQDANKLYNYMVGLVVPDYMEGYDKALFIPDERSIKVQSGSSLVDYLETQLWFERKLPTKLINRPGSSNKHYNLQFVDWIAHCAWIHYEDRESASLDILRSVMRLRQLFF